MEEIRREALLRMNNFYYPIYRGEETAEIQTARIRLALAITEPLTSRMLDEIHRYRISKKSNPYGQR